MKRILPVVSLLVGLLGALSSAAQEAGPAWPGPATPTLREAIQAQTSWESLQHVSSGTKCRVYLKNRDNAVTGLLQQWTPDRVVLSNSKGKLVDCLRPEVQRVETLSPGSRTTRVLAAGLALFGIGMAIGYAIAPQIADDDTLSGGARAGAVALVGGIFGGAAAGLAAIPKAERAALVYRAR
jgi:hypothetical protein